MGIYGVWVEQLLLVMNREGQMACCWVYGTGGLRAILLIALDFVSCVVDLGVTGPHCYRVPEGNEEKAMVDWAGMQGSQGKLSVTTRKSLSWSGRQGGDTRRHVAFRASAGQNISSHPVLPEAGILLHISDSDIHLVYAVWLKITGET